MLIEPTSLPGVLVLTPRTFGDERGFFFESYNARVFSDATGEKNSLLRIITASLHEGYCEDSITNWANHKESLCV